jgi:hypothetical protein
MTAASAGTPARPEVSQAAPCVPGMCSSSRSRPGLPADAEAAALRWGLPLAGISDLRSRP